MKSLNKEESIWFSFSTLKNSLWKTEHKEEIWYLYTLFPIVEK